MTRPYECPVCKSVETGAIAAPEFVDAETYEEAHTCNDCGAKWNNVFRFSQQTDVEEGL